MQGEIKLIDRVTHWEKSMDGRVFRCVSCNNPIEFDKATKLANHHCPTTHERGKAAANTRLESPIERSKTFFQRLYDAECIFKQIGD